MCRNKKSFSNTKFQGFICCLTWTLAGLINWRQAAVTWSWYERGVCLEGLWKNHEKLSGQHVSRSKFEPSAYRPQLQWLHWTNLFSKITMQHTILQVVKMTTRVKFYYMTVCWLFRALTNHLNCILLSHHATTLSKRNINNTGCESIAEVACTSGACPNWNYTS